jgi:hypothetical protein
MGTGRNDGDIVDTSEPGIVSARLIAFDIDAALLPSRHLRWLDNNVVPVLNDGGSATITGLASRSGSDAHNLDLSKRRASAVVEHLRKKAPGQVLFNMNSGYLVKSVDALGERLAESAGQKDGTEDPFYRAVMVSAWHKRMPTPPPKPTPEPHVDEPTLKRITSREWDKFSSRVPNDPPGLELGELVGDIITGMTKGGSDTRTYAMVKARYVISHVFDDFIVNNDMGFGVSTTRYIKTVEYHWGPDIFDGGQVYLQKRQKQIETGRDYGWKIVEARTYPRSEIWKHTIHPDRGVAW